MTHLAEGRMPGMHGSRDGLTVAALTCYPEPMTTTLTNLSLQQLRRAVALKEQITALETELNQILDGSSATPRRRGRPRKGTSARTGTEERNGSNPTKPARIGRRKLSPKARARLSASAKARWAKVKAAGKKSL